MTEKTLTYFIVDAFANRPFTGNPAAVVPLSHWMEDQWLQNVAMEMNLSETAFFTPNADGYDLRWFTPKAEVDLCGHATLAAAVVLARLEKLSDGASVTFHTRSGKLGAERHGSRFQLDFPAQQVEPCSAPAGLLESFNVKTKFVGRGTTDCFIEVESEADVRGVVPDFRLLGQVDCRGVIVTARSDDSQLDFVSRFFAPAVGIDEDPVTGSAHCLLAPFWGSRLNKTAMVGAQVSQRGGIVYVDVRGDRVMLGGDGVIFATGHMAFDY